MLLKRIKINTSLNKDNTLANSFYLRPPNNGNSTTESSQDRIWEYTSIRTIYY